MRALSTLLDSQLLQLFPQLSPSSRLAIESTGRFSPPLFPASTVRRYLVQLGALRGTRRVYARGGCVCRICVRGFVYVLQNGPGADMRFAAESGPCASDKFIFG